MSEYPRPVYEFLAALSQCDFVMRRELPPEFEAPLAVARAADPPLVRVFETLHSDQAAEATRRHVASDVV